VAELKEKSKGGNGGRFFPGDPRINRAGRQLGSRNKFSKTFIDAMLLDFEIHGSQVIETVREKDPSTYVRIATALLPSRMEQEVEIKDNTEELKEGIDWDVITGGLYASKESEGGLQVGVEGKDVQKPKRRRKAS